MGQGSGVVVYWRPGCPYCMLLRAALRRTRLSYSEVNIWVDATAAGYVRSVAEGNETVPTVQVGDRALVNPTVRAVLDTVAEVDPALVRHVRRPRVSERWVLLAALLVVAGAVALLMW